jgi:hypothetical protein
MSTSPDCYVTFSLLLLVLLPTGGAERGVTTSPFLKHFTIPHLFPTIKEVRG